MATVSDTVKTVRKSRASSSVGSVLLNFLGSMNLAITLLVAICIASVIGTVLQQNQPFEDYLIKFGPFWFDIFNRFALYDVYSAVWYLAILAFLVVSTSVCLTRNTPVMLKEMTKFREHQQERSLRAFKSRREWRVDMNEADVEALASRTFKHNNYRMRRKVNGGGTLLAGMAGSSNRMGYILTHLSIVVIGVGGLIDGNLLLKYREWTGDLLIETRNNLPISQISPESRIPPGRSAFRGNVNIPEGGSAGVVFLTLGEGYVVQDLPFRINVEEFRIERYASGEPSAFESDLVLTAPELDEPIRQTISVNYPLTYQGYSIYQSSFGDGGSTLALRAWPLAGNGEPPKVLDQRVADSQQIEVNGQTMTLELTEFEDSNVRPIPGGNSQRDVEVLGPSFQYRLRAPDGTAREFNNYMRPVEIEGRKYFLSGVRGTQAEEFRYLHLPADRNGSPATFLAYLDILASEERLQDASMRAAAEVMEDFGLNDQSMAPQVAATGRDLVRRLLDSGFQGVMTHLDQEMDARGLEGQRKESLVTFSRMALERTLWESYRDALVATGDEPGRELGERDQVFFQDALTNMPVIADYGSPVFLELTDYFQIQSTGLMITRAPGQNIVYLGFALLIGGVFLLFYVSHRRMWCWIRRDGNETILLLAGANQRDPIGFADQFKAVSEEMDQRLQAANAATTPVSRVGDNSNEKTRPNA